MSAGAIDAAGARAQDQAHVTALTRGSGSNFYYSFLFLPRPQREAIHALYAFCREVDDSVDAANDPGEAARRVQFWREELHACYAGRAGHPVTRSLAAHLRTYPVRREDLSEVIEGVAMDVTPRRYQTWDDLQAYCRRVASAVGLACVEIFGYRDPRARDYAVELGLAFQMTNILRDLRADAERGRIYLPATEMTRFGCSDADLTATRATPAFADLMTFQVRRTQGLFDEARRLLPIADRRSLCAARIMGAIYEAILRKIAARVERVLEERTSLSRPRKMTLAAGVYLASRTGLA
jgi:phytoene synthase